MIGTRRFIRDKRGFEISEFEINGVHCISKKCKHGHSIHYKSMGMHCIYKLFKCKPPKKTHVRIDAKPNAVKEASTVRDKLKVAGNTFLKCRKALEHEAIANLCGLPL